MEGANAQKQSTETVISKTGSKFSDTQWAWLQGWCGLSAAEQHKIPIIWKKLDTCSDKDEVQGVLVKLFK